MTTLDVLDIPGKSTTGWTIPSVKKDDNLNESSDNDSVLGDENSTSAAEDSEAAAVETDLSLKSEESFHASVNTGNEVSKTEEGWHVKDGFAEKFLMDHQNEGFDLRHYTVFARVIDFLRKISVTTRLDYPIAVKMSVKPKVHIPV